MAGVDVYRGTSGVSLPTEISSEILTNMQEASAVQTLVPFTNIPGGGKSIPIVTGDPEADWVDETDEISISRPSFANKTIRGYKMGVIVPISNEFRRDAEALHNELVKRLPGALAKKFDATVFGTTGAPGNDFDQIGGATAVAIGPHASDVKKGTWGGLVAALSGLDDNDAALEGWALSNKGKTLLLNQVDSTGRPLLVESILNGSSIATLLGERVQYSKGAGASGTPNRLGFAGEWSSARWGVVQDVTISVTDTASLTDGTTEVDVTVTPSSGTATGKVEVPNILNLWQREMFAVKATVEIGFRARNVNRFVKLTDAARA